MSFFHAIINQSSGEDPGLVYLQENAFFFQDYTYLGGGLALANGNPSFNDLGPNNHDSILSGTPTRKTVSIGSKNWSSLLATLTNGLNLQTNGFTWLQTSSFRLLIAVATNDGHPASLWRFFGTTASPGGYGIMVAVNTTGTLRIDIGNSVDGLATWTSTSAVFTNGVNATKFLDISFNFTTDVLTVLSNGASVAGSWTASNISALTPSNYDTNFNLFIGNRGVNGALASSNANEGYVLRCAMVPINVSQVALDYFNSLVMPSYALSADSVTGDMIALSGDETSIFGGPIYGDIMYYGVTEEVNPGAVRQYSIGAFQFSSSNSGTKLGVILDRGDIGLDDTLEGIFPQGIYIKNDTIYLFCTVNIQAGGNAVGLCTAPTSGPTDLTYIGLVVDDGTNGTKFNHSFCPFDNADDPTYVYAVMSHRDNNTLPLKARVMKSLKSGDLTSWAVVHNDVIFTTDSTENLVYYNIEKRSGIWKVIFGSFNASVGGFSLWQTASENLGFFPEGNELLPPNMTDEEYTSKPVLSADRARMYYSRRAGGAETNYIGVRVKLISDLEISETIY